MSGERLSRHGWNGKQDLVSRSTVCQPKSRGGFNVVNIAFKVCSLHCQWIRRFFSPSFGKWKYFFIYSLFTSLSPVSFQRFFNLPLTIVRSRKLSTFYKSVVISWGLVGGGFDKDLKCLAIGCNTPSALSLPDATTKLCYGHILSCNFKMPRCMSTFRQQFGYLYWPTTWDQVHIFPLDKRVASFRWKMSHDVLFTHAKLVRFGLRQDPSCFCGASCEDLQHLFVECVLARELFPWIQSCISTFLKKPFSLLPRHILFGFSPEERKIIPSIFPYLLNLVCYFIWLARNAFYHEGRPLSSVNIKQLVRSRLSENLNIYFKSVQPGKRRRKILNTWTAHGHVAILAYDKVIIKI